MHAIGTSISQILFEILLKRVNKKFGMFINKTIQEVLNIVRTTYLCR